MAHILIITISFNYNKCAVTDKRVFVDDTIRIGKPGKTKIAQVIFLFKTKLKYKWTIYNIL
jgi:hypothetical protein